jgi:ParB/RepB/Spo0J family partition protein
MAGAGMEVTLIELNRIQPNGYNPNVVPEDILAKLRAEIGQNGACLPIIVRVRGNGYEIIDGQHRWQVCRELGLQEIPCIVQDYSDTEAKIKTLQLNYLRGSAVPIRLASLIHDLNREMTLEELARRLPYEELQMMDTLELLKLPENYGNELEEQALKEEAELPSVISFVVYKNQLETIENAIKTAIKDLPEGTKNLRALALEKICAQYIVKQEVKTKTEAPFELI